MYLCVCVCVSVCAFVCVCVCWVSHQKQGWGSNVVTLERAHCHRSWKRWWLCPLREGSFRIWGLRPQRAHPAPCLLIGFTLTCQGYNSVA